MGTRRSRLLGFFSIHLILEVQGEGTSAYRHPETPQPLIIPLSPIESRLIPAESITILAISALILVLPQGHNISVRRCRIIVLYLPLHRYRSGLVCKQCHKPGSLQALLRVISLVVHISKTTLSHVVITIIGPYSHSIFNMANNPS